MLNYIKEMGPIVLGVSEAMCWGWAVKQLGVSPSRTKYKLIVDTKNTFVNNILTCNLLDNNYCTLKIAVPS